jgi:site-specific recombinase XerD
MTTTTFQSLNVQQAGREWMEIKRPLVRARTIHDYKQHLKPLGAFFAEMPLENIQTEHLREYQKHRIAQKVGPTVINHEIGTLGQILKEARTWHTVQPYYKPLPESREGPGVALSEQQKANLFQTANSKPRWKLAYWAALLSVNTTAGPGEVRNLRIGDVDLPTRYIHIVRGAKNRYPGAQHLAKRVGLAGDAGTLGARETKRLHQSRTLPVSSQSAGRRVRSHAPNE